ncbi:MAG: HAMP domain-containing histidine kinase [Nitrospirae bacterium]|nr:HAMP domain-containing histidine kinase [Nitrospirota bacterium]
MTTNMESCSHRKNSSYCPISKTPCLGECIYASILDDISLGILGLDIVKKEVFFQNKLAVEIFRETIRPKDYNALASLLLSNVPPQASSTQIFEPRSFSLGSRFIGYSIYAISDAYLWIYLSDITEKMRLSAIAEAVNTMNNLGYIFSGIRHELGNPINSIKTTVTVLRKNLQAYSKEKTREFIDRVLDDVTRVELLLKDLKNFSMYENPECGEVLLEHFLEHLLSMSAPDFNARNIRIKKFIRPGAERGWFDARAMQQVMLNIFTNAYDALQSSAAPVISIYAMRVGDRIVLKVMDNGTGMTEEQKKRLFHPFSTTKTHGTGLGLVIVKKMLLKMNGTIEIESAEKSGTNVTISVPAVPDAHAKT